MIIPARNESDVLGICLDALARQTFAGKKEVVVSANACHDNTIEIAESRRRTLEAADWDLIVVNRSENGKPGAFDAGDDVATGAIRVYLDADVVPEVTLIEQIVRELECSRPRYATGTLKLARAESWVTRGFARTWRKLPFMESGEPGAGLYAVNAAGRTRWDRFPNIIADDLFVRLNFAPKERAAVPAGYFWPMAEGAWALVRVRRRQDAGKEEIARLFPQLLQNETKRPMTWADHLRLVRVQPVSYLTYCAILCIVRLWPGRRVTRWLRGR